MLYIQAWRRRLLFAKSKHVSLGWLVWYFGVVAFIAVEAHNDLLVSEAATNCWERTFRQMIHWSHDSLFAVLQTSKLLLAVLLPSACRKEMWSTGLCVRPAFTAAESPLCWSFWKSCAEEDDFTETSEGILMTFSLWCSWVNPIQILSTYKILGDLLRFSLFSSFFIPFCFWFFFFSFCLISK